MKKKLRSLCTVAVSRLVGCSSFVDWLVVFTGWIILLVTLGLMIAGVGQVLEWWNIDMRRHWMTPPTKSPKAQMIVPSDTNQNASLAATISSLACFKSSIIRSFTGSSAGKVTILQPTSKSTHRS